jgi:hypothetical protein
MEVCETWRVEEGRNKGLGNYFGQFNEKQIGLGGLHSQRSDGGIEYDHQGEEESVLVQSIIH